MSSTEDDAPGSILSESSAFNSACGSDSIKAHSTKIQEECKTEVPQRENLQWEFSGLTIWVELEEFGNDLTKAIQDMAEIHGTEVIPQGHMTAIYGMDHLCVEEAKKRLRSVPNKIRAWPKFKKPVGVVQDVAVAGNPGQVCSIAWAQLTLSSDPAHEEAMDLLYDIFYGPSSEKKASRDRPWTPHYSIGYDNPKGTPMTLGATLGVISKLPTLTTCERHAKALSLWSTEGKMGDWECLDRINFF